MVNPVAGGDMISGRLDGDRPGVQLKVLDSLICLPCLPGIIEMPMFDQLILLHSVQRGGGDKVLWAQPVPTWS